MANLNNEQIEMLFHSILSLGNTEECKKYFEDLCTIKELSELAQRLEIARRLKRGDSYIKIAADTGASSATISRVNRCLEYGSGGYDLVLSSLPKLQED